MALHPIDFQASDSAKGISYETLKKYADARGCTVDELINIVMADFLGYKPNSVEADEWEKRLRQAGIPPIEQRQPIDSLRTFFEQNLTT